MATKKKTSNKSTSLTPSYLPEGYIGNAIEPLTSNSNAIIQEQGSYIVNDKSYYALQPGITEGWKLFAPISQDPANSETKAGSALSMFNFDITDFWHIYDTAKVGGGVSDVQDFIWKFDAGVSVPVKSFIMVADVRQFGVALFDHSIFSIEYSNDDQNWYVAAQEVQPGGGSGLLERRILQGNFKARYFRIRFNYNIGGAGTDFEILKIYELYLWV